MLEGSGNLARQRILSPYGRVIASEKATGVVPPKSRIGHQGLFADRLNAPTTFDPLDAGAHTIWHNRNRTLLPELGRFAQRDPNATGQGASSMLDMHGSALHDGVSPPDPAALFGDGQNIYAYAVASPTQQRDPSGLFIGAVAFFMPGPSDFITGALEGMVNGYVANLSWDVEWATDWDMPDEMHTRGSDEWVAIAMMQGVYDAFHIGIPGTDIGFNPLSASARRRGPADDGYYNKHGGPPHFGAMRAIFDEWKKIPGVTGLYLNKAVRSKKLSEVMRDGEGKTLRPDVHFWWRGKLYIYEIWNHASEPAGGKKALYAKIMQNNDIPDGAWVYRSRQVPENNE